MAQSLVFGIDVGTTKVVALLGRVDVRRRMVEVVNIGEARGRGLRRGVIIDHDLAAESIAEAVEDCGGRLSTAVVGIAGSHISSTNTEVTLLNRGRNIQVSERFVKKLEAEAQGVSTDPDERVIHVIPRGYTLDGATGVKNPVGLSARRVTMRAHVVSGAVSSIQNLVRAVEASGVRVSNVILEPVASAAACLTKRDRENGAVLLDIGGGTTDIAVFQRDSLVHTDVVPLGGESFTADLAYGLKISFDDAERLKIRYGTVLSDIVDSVAAVRLGNRHYNAHFMSQILEYRANEILDYVSDSLERAGLGGETDVVLTGGGSRIAGMTELTEERLRIPTRSARNNLLREKNKPLQQPQYSTAVGLLYFDAENNNRVSEGKGASVFSFGSIVETVKGWFGGRQ